MTDTDTTTAPEATTPVKQALTANEPPNADAATTPQSAPEAQPVDYFDTYGQLKSGETLQLLKALGVEESELAKTGTPQLLAVVWKHQRVTLGASKLNDLLELTEKQLLEAINLTPDEYVRQVTAYIEAGSKS